MNRRERRTQATLLRRNWATAAPIYRGPQAGTQLSPALRHFNLGNAYMGNASYDLAIASYRRAIALMPQVAEIWSNIGCAYWRLTQLERAEECLRTALSIEDAHAPSHSNLGGVLEAQGRLAEAVDCYKSALAVEPNHLNARRNLAGVLMRMGAPGLAIEHYRRALELDPCCADTWSDLASALFAGHRTEDALVCTRRALALDPDHPSALAKTADLLRIQGFFRPAIAAYDDLARRHPDSCSARVKSALTQPVILESSDDALRNRERTLRRLAMLMSDGARIDDPMEEIGMTNFYLAYHGLDDLKMQSAIAEFHSRICRNLNWTAAHCLHKKPAPTGGGRIRLAIVCSYLRENTISKLYRGLIEKLSRERFEIVLFRPPHDNEELAIAVDRACERVVQMPRAFFVARQMIADARPDVVLYPEIGMDPLCYFFAFARLAPVQCVGWGHPVTTGIPTVDYFLSSRAAEPANAQSHYSERLICFERLPTYYIRPNVELSPLRREQLGFPERAHIYACPHSLFKFHPDFDAIIAELLRRDPEALVVLIAGIHSNWTRTLASRIARAHPDVSNRIVFAPRTSQRDFIRFLKVADVLLDPFHFGGGNTSYEAFAAGLPIVTYAGEFMRGRVTMACYEQMGMSDLIVTSPKEYVDLAIRLASDLDWRSAMCTKIVQRAPILFEDEIAVSEFEDFLAAAVNAHANGEAITGWSWL